MVVVLEDGTKLEVKIKPIDIVKFERKFNVPVSRLNDEQRYEWLLYLAWLASKRNGVTEDYDNWIDKVEELDISGGADNDQMTGGDGADTFRVDGGTDTITDLTTNDIFLTKFSSFNDPFSSADLHN